MQVNVVGLIDRFVRADDPPRELLPVISDLGWSRVGTAGPLWLTWTNDGLAGYSFENESIEIFTIEVSLFQPEEGGVTDELIIGFEAQYEGCVAEVVGLLGPKTFTTTFDGPDVPVPEEINQGAVWTGRPWTIMVTFQHENDEAPLRVSVWVFREI